MRRCLRFANDTWTDYKDIDSYQGTISKARRMHCFATTSMTISNFVTFQVQMHHPNDTRGDCNEHLVEA